MSSPADPGPWDPEIGGYRHSCGVLAPPGERHYCDNGIVVNDEPSGVYTLGSPDPQAQAEGDEQAWATGGPPPGTGTRPPGLPETVGTVWDGDTFVPKTIAAHDTMIRGVRMGIDCEVHRHAEWVPLEDHHVWPKGMGGPDTPSNLRRLCANGHGQVHAYLDHLIRYGVDIPNDIRKHFGLKVRAVAMAGWLGAGAPRRPAPKRDQEA